MIPNICHFIFGLEPQSKPFLYAYYMAILSAQLVNKPDRITIYYHHMPYGMYWGKLKALDNIFFKHVELPTHVGDKRIKKTAHFTDVLRIEILRRYGGIYLDIDTICVKPWAHLLNNTCVMAKERVFPDAPLNDRGFGPSVPRLCNAVILSQPDTEFMRKWVDMYEEWFDPDGWGEACLILPYKVRELLPESITVLDRSTFLEPCWDRVDDIFQNKISQIPPELITLHLWETHSLKYLSTIDDEWCSKNNHTLYGKIINNLKQYESLN